MEKNEKRKVTAKELESKLELFLREYNDKINSDAAFKYFTENIGPHLSISAESHYIAIDGVNTSGKTTVTELLRISLAEKGHISYGIKTISDLNNFGRIFYKEKWDKAYEIDPFLISSSTYLQLPKTINSNTQTFMLLDRYVLSAEVFLEASTIKDNPNIAKYAKTWFSAFKLPSPDVQVVLVNSKEDYLTRFRLRHNRQPSDAEEEFYTRTKELFLHRSKINKGVMLIDTSKITQQEAISKIESLLRVRL